MHPDFENLVLEGNHIRLEPLSESHAPDLLVAAGEPEIWLYMPTFQPETLEDISSLIRAARETPNRQPFAIIQLASGKAIGSTSYLDIQPPNRGLEIGWTWLGKDYWRSAANTECKYLLLRHAFEKWKAIRVQLKTDSRNLRSQQAIARIGASREGILRNHMIMPDGYYRASVYFSIIDTEWVAAKARLEHLIQSSR
jgi:RimJ/RimL family protein N-acetyltransferase